MAEPKNLSHFIATVRLIALLDANMHDISHANSTIQADEVDYATT
jgi:hypothetical protein